MSIDATIARHETVRNQWKDNLSSIHINHLHTEFWLIQDKAHAHQILDTSSHCLAEKHPDLNVWL